MPDGAHVWLTCDLMAKNCGLIKPWSPGQIRETCDNQPSATALYLRVCLRINSETKTFGFYGATQDGENIVIHGPGWKREYRILRSWGPWSNTEGSAASSKTDAGQAGQAARSSASKVPRSVVAAAEGDSRFEQAKAHLAEAERTLCETIGPSLNDDDVPSFRSNAETGDAFSQEFLGLAYECGRGVGKDYKQAAVWYRKAAEQGDSQAQSSLGSLYFSGRGVPQNYEEAYFWLNLACTTATQAMRETTEDFRDAVVGQLSAEQVARVQARANEWFAEHERTGPNK